MVQLGKGDVREARAVGNRLLGLGIGSGVALAAAFWLAEPFIPSIFSSDAGEKSGLPSQAFASQASGVALPWLGCL